MKKIILTAVVGLLALGLPLQMWSQGCMSDGGEGGGVKGFIQPQFNYSIGDTPEEDEASFTFNRARLGVLGEIPYDIEYYFFAEISPFKNPTNTVHLLDGFVSYTRFAKWAKISLGQFKTPFSREQNTACSGLYTIDRSAVVNQLAGPQRDLGVMVTGGHDSLLFSYSFGLFNGSGINELDDNNNKELVGRVVFNALEFLKIGGSFRMGKTNPTNDEEKLNDIYRYGGELLFTMSNFRFQAEYIMGQDKLYSASKIPIYGGCGGIVGYDTKQAGTYTKGGYLAMASYMTPWNLEPVVKFDNYDVDFDVNDDQTNNLTLGLNYFVNDYSRVQINYVSVLDSPSDNDDMLMVQLQAKF
ncbi:MAG: OprO/OprP family phosphate-selective porin [Bacteroidales bacterium]|nr:OprO/OprP family phosphate-selective porin [Bacteroidales bacterium]